MTEPTTVMTEEETKAFYAKLAKEIHNCYFCKYCKSIGTFEVMIGEDIAEDEEVEVFDCTNEKKTIGGVCFTIGYGDDLLRTGSKCRYYEEKTN